MEAREGRAAPNWRRRLTIAAIVAVSLLVLSFVAALVLPDQEPMPAVVWISGFSADFGRQELVFRANSADGEVIEGAVSGSNWWAPNAAPNAPPVGVSVRRPLGDLAKAKVNLAKIGVLPFARIDWAGFETTGRVEVRNGVEWREFRKFQDDFGQTGIGWFVKFW